MNNLIYISRSLRLLRDHQPWKLVLIFLMTLFNGISSGFSIVLLIPLLQLLDIGSGEPQGIALFLQEFAGRAGITLSLESILIVYLVLLTVLALVQHGKVLLDAGYQQSFIYSLRRRLFRKIITADWTVLNHKSKTNHLQVLTREVPNLASYYYFFLRLISSLLMTLAYTGWAILVSARFTLLVVVTGGVLFLLLRRYLSRAFRLGEGYVSAYTRLLKYIDDFWQTVKMAKVHGSEGFYYQKFDEANTTLQDLEYRMQRNYSLPRLIYRIAGIMVLVLVVYLGYHSGQVPLASFFILILLFSRMFPQFTAINTDLGMIISNLPSVQMVMELDEELTDNKFPETEEIAGLPLERGIELREVTFAYPGGEVLLDRFSASIPARQMTAIVGESGRGKTTLIDLIAGLQRPQSGVILADGMEISGDRMPQWRQSFGYLPQDAFFIDGTLRENLVWDSRLPVGDEDILKVLEQVNALHLIKRFRDGLDARIVNYGFHFSGGERQRLALARVLLRNPRVLLLDEATSSLDSENEQQILEVLKRLSRQVTVVMVSHRESVAAGCGNVIRLPQAF